jgi:leader peptidase (prepilin peptidase)/N-methyltransferase
MQPLESLSARRTVRYVLAGLLAAGLLTATLLEVRPMSSAALYAAAQVLLVAAASVDLATRRIPNALVLALALIGVVPRVVAGHAWLVDSLVSGAVVLGIALLLAHVARGGLGAGDVKLAAALGLLLGKTVVAAFFIGSVLGALAGLAIIVRQGRRSTLAYGPYLATGAAAAIIFLNPPPLL